MDVSFAGAFFYSEVCLFTLLTVSFTVQRILHQHNPLILFFHSFVHWHLGGSSFWLGEEGFCECGCELCRPVGEGRYGGVSEGPFDTLLFLQSSGVKERLETCSEAWMFLCCLHSWPAFHKGASSASDPHVLCATFKCFAWEIPEFLFCLHLILVGSMSKFGSPSILLATAQRDLGTARVGETRAESVEGWKAGYRIFRVTW